MSQDLSNLNLGGGNQAGLPGMDGLYQVQQTSIEQTQPSTSQPTKDTIEKASQLAALYLPLLMSNPVLIPPDPNYIMAITQLEMDRICLNILDSWSKNLQQIAEEKKEADRRDEINPLLKEIHVTAGLLLAVATIFLRAIFGTQVAEAIQKPSEMSDDKAIALRFASQLNQWSLDGTLNGYLMTIVDELPSSANLSEDQKMVVAKQLQVMLLASALAGIYKTQTQWITAEEFINILSNPTTLNDPQAVLLAVLLVNTLNDLPEVARSRMAKTLTLYMNTNPDLPTLFDLNQTAGIQLSILNNSRS